MADYKTDAIEKAKQRAYRVLGYRQRSCWELAGKLAEKGFSAKIVESTVKDLKRAGYLDDRKFARDYIEWKLASSPAGRKYFETELAKKHISREITQEVLEEFFPEDREFEIARGLALKRMSRYSDIDIKSKRKKIYSYLGRKGFPTGVINRICSAGTELYPEQPI